MMNILLHVFEKKKKKKMNKLFLKLLSWCNFTHSGVNIVMVIFQENNSLSHLPRPAEWSFEMLSGSS